MFKIDTITLFAFFGTLQGLIFAAIFWFKNKTFSNKVFALLLLATSIRIVKNVFVHLRELNPEMFLNYEVWQASVYLGISHQLAIGPLFLLYFQSKLNPKFKWTNKHWWHFLPYVLFLGASPLVKWGFWANGGLWFCYISLLVYYLLSFRLYYHMRFEIDSGTSVWLKGLLFAVGALMLAYSPALFHYVGYVGGAALYAIAILITGYVMLTNQGKVSFFRTKYETSSLRKSKIKEIKGKLSLLMEEQRPYLDTELTMQKLADQLGIQSHHLSRVVNQEFKMSFADYINAYRLKEAVARLKNPRYDHLKISALAYECGFNSVPTFNTLFKKVHKSTPTHFRKEYRASQSSDD